MERLHLHPPHERAMKGDHREWSPKVECGHMTTQHEFCFLAVL